MHDPNEAVDLLGRIRAEGIETEEQLGMLRDNGCDMGQSYRTGRPMLAEDFVAWSHSWKIPRNSIERGLA